MVGLPGSVEDGGGDVVGFKERVVAEDFRVGRSRGEKVQYITHANALAANAWPASAHGGVDGDSGKKIGLHERDYTTAAPRAVEQWNSRSVDQPPHRVASSPLRAFVPPPAVSLSNPCLRA
jgi:hypothetical protein